MCGSTIDSCHGMVPNSSMFALICPMACAGKTRAFLSAIDEVMSPEEEEIMTMTTMRMIDQYHHDDGSAADIDAATEPGSMELAMASPLHENSREGSEHKEEEEEDQHGR